MFINETSNKFSREIPLEHVSLQMNIDDERDHYFEIRTEPTVYYCGYKRTRNRVKSVDESLLSSLDDPFLRFVSFRFFLEI